MRNITFHCLFEQSGTFKNVFKSHGHQAYDYDILNDYGQTDFQIDLFKEIEKAYDKLITYGDLQSYGGFGRLNEPIKTTFDDMKPETDFIIAFFPCTYFTDTNELQFKLWNGGKKLPRDKRNIERLIKRNKDRGYFFELWLKFCFVCEQIGIPTIAENPAVGNKSYLRLYSPYEPSFTDMDRTKWGDVFKKPTHFFAINFEMKEKFEMFDKEYYGLKQIQNCKGKDRQRERSEITPRYAENFYKRFIQHAIDGTSICSGDAKKRRN